MKVKKAIIPAAGLGTRFLPATKSLPKEMLPIVDKPVIQFIVEEAVASGIEDILIITGKNKRAIEDHFDKSYELEETLKKRGKDAILEQIERISQMANIHYIRQKEPRGLGDAVWQAKTFIGDEPFALLLGDDIVQTPPDHKPGIQQLLELYNEYEQSIIGVLPVKDHEVDRYGIVISDQHTIVPGEDVAVRDLIEKPNPTETDSRIAIMGRYILDAKIFEFLEHTQPGKGKEIQLTDALRAYNQQYPMRAYSLVGNRYDVGTPLGFLAVNLAFAMKNPDYAPYLQSLLKQLQESETNKEVIT